VRILFPTLSRFPTSEAPAVQVANMAQAFAELGHVVRLVVPAGEAAPGATPPTPDAMVERYGFRPAFEVATLSRRIHRGQSYLHAARIARMAQRWGADLVFSRNLRACLLPALRGIPTVYEAHTLTSLTGRQDRWTLERLQRAHGFRGIVAISEGLAEDLAQAMGVPRRSIHVAHDAVRITEVPSTRATRSPADRIRVAYTGSMFPGRGVELLVAIAERDDRIELHLVGGPEAAARAWSQQAPRAVASGRIVLHGTVAPARARELQRAADVLVAPFARRVLTDSGVDSSRWMSPMKVFEYMASGRPIVTSDLPVLREVLRPDVDALMVPSEDVDALAAAVVRIADDPALGERLAASALARVQRELTWSLRASGILERLGPAPSGGPAGAA
jgi:glycosyltransferase involved in cell wall biosynthesis